MIVRLQRWWEDRSARERWMLGVMFALLIPFVLFFGLIRPLSAASEAARARYERAVQGAGEVAATADALRRTGKDTAEPLSTTLPSTISQSALAAGFTLTSVEPQGDGRVAIVIPAARAPALFGWIGSLAKFGIVVERLTLRNNPDGALGVEATLRGPR